MTPDDLQRLCESKICPLGLADGISGLEEPERKALAGTVQDVYRQARKSEPSSLWGRGIHQAALARLAMLACCNWTQAKRVHGDPWRLFPDSSQDWQRAILRILSDRRPAWASAWVNLQLDEIESSWQPLFTWTQVRQLVTQGVIDRPTSAGYAQAMVLQSHQLDESMIDEQVIGQDIWRLFEVETRAFATLGPLKDIDREKWSASIGSPLETTGTTLSWNGGWPRVIYFLAANNLIDRGQLLRAILGTFWKDFNASNLSALARFHELVDPTDNEIADNESHYHELLACSHGPAVAFAIKALGRLHKLKKLNVHEFLNAVPAVFEIPTKTQPKSALSLIERVCRSQDKTEAMAALGAALNHDSPDIQEKAVAILQKWKRADDALDITPALASAPMIAPQHRRTLEAFAGIAVGETAEGSISQEIAELEARADALSESIQALPSWIRDVCRLSDCKDSLAAGKLPSGFDPQPTTCPVLSGVEPIEPIQDIDQLIDVAMLAVSQHEQPNAERPEDPERIVDAILRFGHDKSDNFEAKTEILRTELLKQLEHGTWMWHSGMWTYYSLHLMLARWLTLPVAMQFQASQGRKSGVGFINRMLGAIGLSDISRLTRKLSSAGDQTTPLDWLMLELFQRLDRNQFGPVLSSPTHRSGWIDPQVFVNRLREMQLSGLPIGTQEFICGLLRLAPDRRREVLHDADSLFDPERRIVRYALGAADLPTPKDAKRADLWLAAGRVRDPFGCLPELAEIGFTTDLPDAISPARFELSVEAEPSELLRNELWSTSRFVDKIVRLTPRCSGKPVGSRPTVSLAQAAAKGRLLTFFDEAKQFQVASITPSNPTPVLVSAAHQLLLRVDDNNSMFEQSAGLMSPLLDVDRPWCDVSRTVLWLGLLSKDEQARGIAVEALIDGITDGRANATRLSQSLLRVTSWAKLNRLAKSLREVARTSLLAERVVAEILDGVIASWDILPRDGHHILSLQLELLSNLRMTLSDEARRVLGHVKGSGKAARLAKRLCELPDGDSTYAQRLTAIEAVEGLAARAQRIVRSQNDGVDARQLQLAGA